MPLGESNSLVDGNGSSTNGPRDLVHFATAVFTDFAWLLGVQLSILLLTGFTGGWSEEDLRVHAAMLAFLLPGWLLAPRFFSAGTSLAKRYAVATIISFSIHGLLVWPGSIWGLGFRSYYAGFLAALLVAVGLRMADIRRHGYVASRLHPGQLAMLWFAATFICVVWRVPSSNDVGQFLPQQVDMLERRTLAPSPIGMTAFGIDRPMPRWNANVFHVWFSLLADVTRLPVEGLIRRWATIPFAVIALLLLSICVADFCNRRTPMWAVVLAVFGPVTLWFRDFNAWVYGFRLTNNFCLDKDFALFWLIPAWLWLFRQFVRSRGWSAGGMLLALSPLCLKIHPMTPVYLLLLVPFAVVMATPANRDGVWRSMLGTGLAFSLFLVALLSADAQAFHEQMEILVHLDAERSRETGGPLHHWVGQYGTLPELGIDHGTTAWRHGRMQLKSRLVTGCGALLMMHVAALGWGILLLAKSRQGQDNRDVRRWFGVAIALLILWSINQGSILFLNRAPHLYRGYERLHWFCYVPALVASASFFGSASDTARRWMVRWMSARRARLLVWLVPTTFVVLHLGEQAWHVGHGAPTILRHVSRFHSLFDFDRYDGREAPHTRQIESRFAAAEGPLPPWPSYLRPDDRVLLLTRFWPLDTDSPLFWELRQSVWWSELYGESYALFVWGDPWLTDWRRFYDAVDWRPSPELDDWIVNRQVTLIVDNRPGAAEFIDQLGPRIDRQVTQVAPHVWRLSVRRG